MRGFCFQIIDLGTQPMTFNGRGRHLRRIMLTWETPEGARSKNYTYTLAGNATLKRDLNTWGSSLDEALGRWAELTISGEHILAVRPAMRAWDPEHRLRRFDIQNPDLEVMAELPPRVQEMIRRAPEWRG